MMRTLVWAAASLFTLTANAAEHSTSTYKTVGDRELQVRITQPNGHSTNARAPAVVYFHPGGWRGGSPESVTPYAEAFAEHGIVTLSVEYRLVDAVTTLDEPIRDAAAALRWTRERARRLGIDPGKIIALGHSAGGHLAAAAAMLRRFDGEDDYTRASPRPNALVLMAPARATKETAGQYVRPGTNVADYEPRDNIDSRAPPTLIIQGDSDETVPRAQSRAYYDALLAAGVKASFVTLPGIGHRFDEDGAKAAVSQRLIEFIRELGYLD